MKMFDANKTTCRMIGLPYGEKTMTICLAFSSDTGTSRTDRQTDRRTDGRTDKIPISISRVSVLTRDKKHFVYYAREVLLSVFCVSVCL